jgi:hypothetical protein
MLTSLAGSLQNWVKGGFQTTSDAALNKRLEICQGCDFWDAQGFSHTGRCKKCGCSTWAKLRLATERCPIGKWEAVESKPEPEC